MRNKISETVEHQSLIVNLVMDRPSVPDKSFNVNAQLCDALSEPSLATLQRSVCDVFPCDHLSIQRKGLVQDHYLLLTGLGTGIGLVDFLLHRLDTNEGFTVDLYLFQGFSRLVQGHDSTVARARDENDQCRKLNEKC